MKISRFAQATVIATALVFTGGAMAQGEHHGGGGRSHHNASHQKMNGFMKGHHGQFTEMQDRKLTADQIKTVVEAKLIMMDNENVKVGKIEETKDGFNISIVTTKSGDLVRTMELAKNGMPKRAMERMEKHLKARDAKGNHAS